jgi:perosamine synthetase
MPHPSPTSPSIPLTRPVLGEPECAAAAEAMLSGWVTQGPMVERFERAVADYVGATEAVAASSGTAALHLALLVAGVKPGDEVIVPSLTFIATANAVRYCGAAPVFADVERETFNLDPVSVGQKISPRTRAIVAVHQFGRPADLAALAGVARRHRCTLIEDAACALGASYCGRRIGSHSTLVCFSFHPRKIITTGEGGMVTTSDAGLAERLRRLRHHGVDLADWQRHRMSGPVRERFVEVGFNYRLSDPAAAVGLKQMERLDGLIVARRRFATGYDEAFHFHPALEIPRTAPDAEWNGQTYAIVLSEDASCDRESVLARLRRDGVGARHGLSCIHREPCYAADFGETTLPRSDWLSERMILLPLFPEMTPGEHRRVIESLRGALDGRVQGTPAARTKSATGAGLRR